MPRTLLTTKYSEPKRPPIDWLRAAILERQAVYGYNLQKLADIGGCSYTMMRTWIRRSPWEWPKDLRNRICKEFGLIPFCSVLGAPEDINGAL